MYKFYLEIPDDECQEDALDGLLDSLGALFGGNTLRTRRCLAVETDIPAVKILLQNLPVYQPAPVGDSVRPAVMDEWLNESTLIDDLIDDTLTGMGEPVQVWNSEPDPEPVSGLPSSVSSAVLPPDALPIAPAIQDNGNGHKPETTSGIKNCDFCGKTFTPEWPTQMFCGNCRESPRGPGSKRRTYAEKPCSVCGKMFTPTGPAHKKCPTCIDGGLSERMNSIVEKAKSRGTLDQPMGNHTPTDGSPINGTKF